MLKGIDISVHDGAIDFDKVKKSGLADFAIIRAGYGKSETQRDKRFLEYYVGCKKAGIPIGCYWYSYAKSVDEIAIEAAVFQQVIKGKRFEYPIYLDFEEKSQFALGKETCTKMAEKFLSKLESAGYYVGIYSSKSHLENYFSEDLLRRYTVWVAHYGVDKTSYKYPYDIWQYSSDGSVAGINHRVDMNYCYKTDFPYVIKSAGLNGFPKQDIESVKRSIKVTMMIDDHEYSGLLEEA